MAHQLEQMEDGTWEARVDSEDGHGIQVYKGATEKEVIDKLLIAQTNATKKINEQSRVLRNTSKPDLAAPEAAPRRPLTADEMFTVHNDLADASKAPGAVRRVVEAELGMPLETVRKVLTQEQVEDRERKAFDISKKWAAANPEFYASDYNGKKMADFLFANKWDCTENNLTLAFAELSEAGLLQTAPEERGQPAPEEEEERIAPTPAIVRPRAASTGLRNRHVSGGTPPAGPRTQTLTVADIERMPEAEYREKFQDPKFREAVDQAYARAAAERRQRLATN